ncbi:MULTISPECIES: DUF2273 domain-containing protein [unclassified Gordonia (in: high G+C Gram-positive bacteria)]|uniref:DUF2273 domain-containing protein n=1 Tax=unclassified Gordonia (in: high G+C Gram-positive bacteria) TaxID=2657482 RepID=UPI001FFF7517|nr:MULTISPECIES: DUF2273 domain-containing protein [unclassified Gordonia (in: high G+C Gram-positive bacteria)]UQE75273.1 DUF2273 domain-containing protein [Gordonia sp. PP30]
MNNFATIGLLAGLLLALCATTGGLVGFLIGVVLGGIGLILGLHRDGSIDLTAVVRSRNRG